jgi:hypothetical protein
MADVYEIRDQEDPKEWDAFVGTAVGGTLFSTSAWLACAAEALGAQCRRFGLYKNGHLVAGVSGCEGRRAGMGKFTTPLLTPHGGVLLAPVGGKGPAKMEAEAAQAMRRLADFLTGRFDYVNLTQAPALHDVRHFVWAGWQAQARYTYMFETGDADSLWERLERRTRTVVRKAEKSGFVLQPSVDFSLLRQLYEKIFAARDGSPLIDSGAVERFAASACAAGLAEIRQVESADGQVAAMVAFALGEDTAYAWLPGAEPAMANTGALSLLYWNYLKECPRPRFDFVGANLESIAKFKRGFGGELVPYFAVEGYRSALVQAAMRGKGAVRQLLSG